MSSTALHVAAFRNAHDRIKFIGRLKPFGLIYNVDRPTNAYDTLRVLAKEGQCDPIATSTVVTIDDRRIVHSSVLHAYTDHSEGFQYLLKQERFVIDLTNAGKVSEQSSLSSLFA